MHASVPDPELLAAAAASPPAGNQPQLRFIDLAQGHREILIEHLGQIYRLRVTRNEKLILQK